MNTDYQMRERQFWSRAILTANDQLCWTWTGYLDPAGYGKFCLNGRQTSAHRIAYFFWSKKWPSLCVLHSCDNPACVNPNHLREGTPMDNAIDKLSRGRQPQGENNVLSKLRNQDIFHVRELLARSVPQKEIAIKLGVDQSTISLIKTGRRWKHI